MEELKLTEDETILLLMDYLKLNDWEVIGYCLGQARGYDIVAKRNNQKLFVEVKGAKAGENSPTKKRKYFDSGQIKDHLGKAIVKSFETQNNNPNSRVAIAHPDDPLIRKTIGAVIPNINKSGILHFWVKPNGEVEEELIQNT